MFGFEAEVHLLQPSLQTLHTPIETGLEKGFREKKEALSSDSPGVQHMTLQSEDSPPQEVDALLQVSLALRAAVQVVSPVPLAGGEMLLDLRCCGIRQVALQPLSLLGDPGETTFTL